MKKISIILSTACALWALSSCHADKEPIYQRPAEGGYVLNTPVLQNQYIDLENATALDLVTSQPDYGYSAVANYGAQMSLTEDFNEIFDLTPADKHNASLSITASQIAVGFSTLMGYESEDEWNEVYNTTDYPDGVPYTQMFFRTTCELEGVPGSLITSNVVSYNYLKPYYAVLEPGYIYLVGTPTGWVTPDAGAAATYAEWRLYENENAIGSKIYVGKFDIDADPMFRFYTALTGWDQDSYGSQVDDDPIQFPEFNGTDDFTKELVKGKGSFEFPNWPGGMMTITVNMADEHNMTVTIQAGDVFQPNYIYMMGSLNGWKAPSTDFAADYEDYRLANSADSQNIYTGSFDVDGEVYIRFALSLMNPDDSNDNGWDNPNQIGPEIGDGNVNCTFNNGEYSSPYILGQKSNWVFNVSPGTLDVAVDLDNETVTFSYSEN